MQRYLQYVLVQAMLTDIIDPAVGFKSLLNLKIRHICLFCC